MVAGAGTEGTVPAVLSGTENVVAVVTVVGAGAIGTGEGLADDITGVDVGFVEVDLDLFRLVDFLELASLW